MELPLPITTFYRYQYGNLTNQSIYVCVQEMDDLEQNEKKMARQERELLQNRRRLEEAKEVGYEMDDMARDIKFNLQTQSDKLEKSTLKNLYAIQKDMVMSSRLLQMIKAQRGRNKLIMYGIMALICISILFVIFVSFRGGD